MLWYHHITHLYELYLIKVKLWIFIEHSIYSIFHILWRILLFIFLFIDVDMYVDQKKNSVCVVGTYAFSILFCKHNQLDTVHESHAIHNNTFRYEFMYCDEWWFIELTSTITYSMHPIRCCSKFWVIKRFRISFRRNSFRNTCIDKIE